MFQKLFSDTFIYSIPTVFNRLIGIIFSIFLIRYLGPESFASIELLALTLVFLERVLSLEINRGFGREVSNQNIDKISQFVNTYLSFLFLTGIIFGLILFLVPNIYLEKLLSINLDLNFLILFFILVLTNLFYLKILEVFRWALFPITYSLISFGGTFLTSLLSFILIFFYEKTIESFVLGQLLGQAFFLIVGLFLLSKEFNLRFFIDLDKLKSMLSFSYPIFIFLILLYFLNYSDRWILSYFYESREVGIYSGIYRLTSILSIALLGSRLAFTPIALKYTESKSEFSSIFHFIIFSLTSLSLVISAFSKQLTLVLLGDDYSDASYILPFLLIAKIGFTAFIFSPGLEINKETKKMIYISLFPLIFGGLTTFFLTREYGVIGASIGTCISSFLFIFLCLFLNQKTGIVKYNWKGFLKVSLIYFFSVTCLIILDIILIKLLIILLSIVLFWKVLFTENEKKTLFKALKEIKSMISGYAKRHSK